MSLPIISSLTPSFDERRDGVRPSLVILHYTNTLTAEEALARYHDQNPADGFGRLSPHYLIAQDGRIWQLVAEDKRAWHAGLSWWHDLQDINSHSIGIELAGLGDTFPQAQIAALVPLVQGIYARWGIPAENVLGHNDIAPGRKVDPGPNMPWPELARHGVGVWPQINEKTVAEEAVEATLRAIGYTAPVTTDVLLEGFQTHFVPEVFKQDKGAIGQPTLLTRQRLFALKQLICQN